MQNADKHVKDYWRVDLTRKSPLDAREFPTDVEALAYVGRLRELDDPAYEPDALVHVIETTTVAVTKFRLGPDAAEILEEVRQKFLELEGTPPDGEDGLTWAVKTTMEALSGR